MSTRKIIMPMKGHTPNENDINTALINTLTNCAALWGQAAQGFRRLSEISGDTDQSDRIRSREKAAIEKCADYYEEAGEIADRLLISQKNQFLPLLDIDDREVDDV